MSINNPDCNHDQSQASPSDVAKPHPPPPKPAGDIPGCAYTIIDNDKPNDDTSPPRSQSARTAFGFYLRWAVIVLNVGLELAQIILALEASGGKIKGPTYRALTATTSSVCLLLSAIEVLHATRPNGVVSKRKPRKIGFGVWFGLVSSAVQFSVNVAALAVKKCVVNFDYLGFLFAVCYFFAAISGGRRVHLAVVKCASHGSCEAEGKFVDGIWVFECSQCTDGEIKLA